VWLCSPAVLPVRHSRTLLGRCVQYASMCSLACQSHHPLHVSGDGKQAIMCTTWGVIRPCPAPQPSPNAVSTMGLHPLRRLCRSGSVLALAMLAAPHGAGDRSMVRWSVGRVTHPRMRRWWQGGKVRHEPALADIRRPASALPQPVKVRLLQTLGATEYLA
jgi:hypothetical protein